MMLIWIKTTVTRLRRDMTVIYQQIYLRIPLALISEDNNNSSTEKYEDTCRMHGVTFIQHTHSSFLFEFGFVFVCFFFVCLFVCFFLKTCSIR